MNLTTFGFLRVASASPELRIGNTKFNVESMDIVLQKLAQKNVSICVFPELSITGYTCGDLFYQEELLAKTTEGILKLSRLSLLRQVSFVAGFPLLLDGKLYNCAGFFHNGSLLGIVPKTYLPSTNEFYEQRWFTPSTYLRAQKVFIGNEEIPIGTDLIFSCREYPFLKIGIEICEDLWTVIPPSGSLALSGATLLLNPSASPETLGKYKYRKELVSQQSARTLSAYIYSSAGPWESSTDLVYSGHCLIAENGTILSESERFSFSSNFIISEIDLQKIQSERVKNTSFARSVNDKSFRNIPFSYSFPVLNKLEKIYSQTPFVPGDLAKRNEHCSEIFQLQATGLTRRIHASKAKKLVIGVSGGLDSTLALLVCQKAKEKLGGTVEILGITMPGFGTTSRTKSNAEKLSESLGIEFRTIPIQNSVLQHFKDIGHDPETHDVTYENAQARERTQILMDIANKENGIVVGTGDLSELALGFCTYNADQMSMYNVNAGVPKTLVKYVIDYCAEFEFDESTRLILKDIIDTPISPELLPHSEDKIVQETESIIGPYILHDFFLFHFIRNLFSKEKILLLAEITFQEDFTKEEISKWFDLFRRRFFSNQFKRSAMPDGVKIGSVALSPRGDWRMPSDADIIA